jgi:hypothetical protein
MQRPELLSAQKGIMKKFIALTALALALVCLGNFHPRVLAAGEPPCAGVLTADLFSSSR